MSDFERSLEEIKLDGLTAPTAKADGIPNSQRAALHRIFDAESSAISKG